MAALLVARPAEGWCSVNPSILTTLVGKAIETLIKPKEEKKEEKKEEPKSEPEKKRSGGIVGSASKRADGCAVKGKTRGKIV
jgi:hypothetical protein